jgi:hypothetical protein
LLKEDFIVLKQVLGVLTLLWVGNAQALSFYDFVTTGSRNYETFHQSAGEHTGVLWLPDGVTDIYDPRGLAYVLHVDIEGRWFKHPSFSLVVKKPGTSCEGQPAEDSVQLSGEEWVRAEVDCSTRPTGIVLHYSFTGSGDSYIDDVLRESRDKVLVKLLLAKDQFYLNTVGYDDLTDFRLGK